MSASNKQQSRSSSKGTMLSSLSRFMTVAPIDPEDWERDGDGAISYEPTRPVHEEGLIADRSSLRKHLGVDELSSEYQGKKVSRKQLKKQWKDQDEDEEEDEEEQEEEEQEEEGDDDDDDDAEEEEFEDDDEEQAEDDSEADEDGFEMVNEDDDEQEEMDDDDSDGDVSTDLGSDADVDAATHALSHHAAALERELQALDAAAPPIIKQSTTNSLTKSVHVRHQREWMQELMNVRILIQPLVQGANQLPPALPSSQQQANHAQYDKALATCHSLLTNMLDLQHDMMSINSIWESHPTRKRKHDAVKSSSPDVEALSQHLSDMDAFIKPICDEIIDKWNEKTQMDVGHVAHDQNKFKVLNQSIRSQIDNALIDHVTLLQKSRTQRVDYPLIGRAPSSTADNQGADAHHVVHDAFIYDDNDSYSQLLHDIIASGSVEAKAQAAAARKRQKRSVDTRASKGRKIKYIVHPKLANFMAPNAASFVVSKNDFATDELFCNLFGGHTLPNNDNKH